MIDLGALVRTLDGVTVFADHADPKRFHYVPVRPRLVVDEQGHPQLRLLKYHLDPTTTETTGAGLLELTVDLLVAEDLLAQVKAKVAAAVGRSGITLTPVWADSGSCQLVLLDSGTTTSSTPLVANVLGGGTPDLPSNATTMFACTLDPAGVGIVEEALRSGGLPFGVVYQLEVAGLRPALHATITADYQASYHYYENRLHGGRLLLAADLGETVQDLVQKQAIVIKVDDLVPDADKQGIYQAALNRVQQYVLETLFTPTISKDSASTPPDPTTGLVPSLLGLFTITYSLTTVDSSELKTLSYTLAVAQSEEITLAPQAELTALVPAGSSVDALITTVNAAPPNHLSLDVASLVDLAGESIDHLDVTLTYAGKDTSVTLDAATPRRTLSLWYDAPSGLEATYRYDVQLAATGPKGLTGRLSSGPGSSLHDLVRIDPRALYQSVQLRPLLQGVPLDRYPRVIVDVEAHEALDSWTATDTVTLDAGTPEASLRYRGRRDGLVSLRSRLRYVQTDGQELTRDWRDTDSGPLLVPDPQPDVVTVQVLGSARFGTAITELVVELRSHRKPEAVASVVLTAAVQAAAWTYQPGEPGTDRGYDYRVTVQTTAGEVRPGTWQLGPDDPHLVVGEGYSQLRTVKVVFVGSTLAAAGRLAAKVRLSADDGVAVDEEFLVQDPVGPLTWSYPVADPAKADHTLQITWVGSDGTSTDAAPQTGPDLLHVVPLVAVP